MFTKPHFEPGDRVRHKKDGDIGTVDEVQENGTVSVVWDISGCVSDVYDPTTIELVPKDNKD